MEEVEKYEKIFQKIHGKSPIEKTISTITVMNIRWPREDVKLFVNVRFFNKMKKLNVSPDVKLFVNVRIFNKMKKLNVSLKKNNKKNVKTLKQTAQFMFDDLSFKK